MMSLLKKELTANFKYFRLGLLFFVVYAFIFTERGAGTFTLCLSFLYYTVSVTNLSVDERNKIELLLSTLPIRRRTVVASKYVMAAVIFMAGVAVYTFLSLAARLAGYPVLPPLDLFSAMLGLFSISVFNALTIPLSYRFGAQTTRYVPLALFLVLFILTSASNGFGPSVNAFLGRLGTAQVGLLLLAASLLVGAVSFAVALPIYERKDF